MAITSNSDWRAELAAYRASLIHEMTLPVSGLTFKLKQVSLADLMVQGQIPDALSGLVDKVMSSGDGKMELAGDDLGQIGQMFDVVVLACVVSPPISREPDEDTLGLSEIPFNDKEAIFSWANGEASALSSFRSENGTADTTAPVGEYVPQTAE